MLRPFSQNHDPTFTLLLRSNQRVTLGRAGDTYVHGCFLLGYYAGDSERYGRFPKVYDAEDSEM